MKNLIDYTLHLADDALILGHRNSEWCGHGPILEQDIAITNISLDLIGQARNFYQYAAQLVNTNKRRPPQTPPCATADAEGGTRLEVPEQSEGKERSSGEANEDTFAYFRNSEEF